jgi:putative ABC transport system substrate-binding protein
MLLSRHTKRREFITLLGGATAWPIAARAQQASPLIGYLGVGPPASQASTVAGFRQGLSEGGYDEGRNATIEFRWAGEYDALPEFAADLVRRRANVLFMNSPSAVRAAMAATTTVPIVFIMGEDPVEEGIVSGLNRPGGNVTGVSDYSNQLAGKQLGLLRDTVPAARLVGLLVNPTHPHADADTREAQAAAAAIKWDLRVFKAAPNGELETAFQAMVQLGVGALMVNVDPYLSAQRESVIALAARYAIPAIYPGGEYARAGGLMSYEADRFDASRQAGGYVARILKGTKPADLPVFQATKLKFAINLKTAKALGLDIPSGILAIADEVFE